MSPIEAYLARPIGTSNVPGVVVIHHMPGWDEWTREVVRKFAAQGYAAIAPHLFSRFGRGPWDDVAAAARAAGGVSDAQVVGDVDAAAKLLRRQPYANGKVGIIGFCSGGRQAYMLACKLDSIDAAVDCWGGRVIPTAEDITPLRPEPVDRHDAQHARARFWASSATTTPTPTSSRSTAPRPSSSGTAKTTSSIATTAPATASSPPTAPTTARNRPSTAGRRSSPFTKNTSPCAEPIAAGAR